MIYKFAERSNYEDFAAGHVIYHRPGFTNYPVRLASEIFMRAYTHCGREMVKLYDPCCGGGYLLTVLGFLHGDKISAIYGSDISAEAVFLSKRNLQLLSPDALLGRGVGEKAESATRLVSLCRNIEVEIFARDVLSQNNNPPADIIVTDIPYGDMTFWKQGSEVAGVSLMLQNLNAEIVAVSSDKKQKIAIADEKNYRRLEKFNVGKRKIEILRYGE